MTILSKLVEEMIVQLPGHNYRGDGEGCPRSEV